MKEGVAHKNLWQVGKKEVCLEPSVRGLLVWYLNKKPEPRDPWRLKKTAHTHTKIKISPEQRFPEQGIAFCQVKPLQCSLPLPVLLSNRVQGARGTWAARHSHITLFCRASKQHQDWCKPRGSALKPLTQKEYCGRLVSWWEWQWSGWRAVLQHRQMAAKSYKSQQEVPRKGRKVWCHTSPGGARWEGEACLRITPSNGEIPGMPSGQRTDAKKLTWNG